MKNRAILLLTITLLLLGQYEVRGQTTGKDRDEAAIRALVKQVERANNAGDVEGWVSLFASDFVYMPPNLASITRREALTDIAKAGFRNQASIRIEPSEIHICGNWAFSRSHVTGTIRLYSSGKVVSIDLRQLVVYSRNKQGLWRISRLMINKDSEEK